MTTGSKPTDLVLMPILKAHRTAQGRLVVTQKYLDGATEYAKSGRDRLSAFSSFRTSLRRTWTMSRLTGRTAHTGSSFCRDRQQSLRNDLNPLLWLSVRLRQKKSRPRSCATGSACRLSVSEYTLKTEWQIIDAQGANPIVTMRRKQWAWKTERVRRRLIRLSAGLQCNGTPTFDAYRPICPDAFLYFDNRVREADVITPQELRRKADRLRQGAPLRLVFGGGSCR